jgi:hypothetical protein
MANQEVTLDELEEIRDKLFKAIPACLTADERRFILSIKKGEPEWDLLPIKGIDKLPAIQWKLLNIKKMSSKNHVTSINRLRKILEI